MLEENLSVVGALFLMLISLEDRRVPAVCEIVGRVPSRKDNIICELNESLYKYYIN
jgi:hypothetical protein